MRVVVSLLCLLLSGLAAAQIPSEARVLQATKQQWLAEYLMHYDEAHFQTPFRTQQALLLQDSV
ncbi:MAG: hypothetical protein ACKO66_01905, partial [Flavobacteriales bacterium]